MTTLCLSLILVQMVFSQSLIDRKASKKTNNLYQNLKNNRRVLLLKNKFAVVTGCNRGIGKEIVRIFAENGAAGVRQLRKRSHLAAISTGDIRALPDQLFHTKMHHLSFESPMLYLSVPVPTVPVVSLLTNSYQPPA